MKTKTVEQCKRTVWAKCRLTHKQYHGGPYMTPLDHLRVGEVLGEVYGDYTFSVPSGPTGQWGYLAWEKVIKPIGSDMGIQNCELAECKNKDCRRACCENCETGDVCPCKCCVRLS